MNDTLVLCDESRPGVRTLTLNRPKKRNALNIDMLRAFVDLMRAANADESLRVIVIRGCGDVFCAGLDLHEARDPSRSEESAHLIADMLRVVHGSPKVTVAAVHGAAMAGGAGLMSACDIAVATVESRIGYPEVRVGLVAGLVMSLLRRQVNERHARELLLLGEPISGERAEQIGLVTRAVPEDMLDDTVELIVDNALKGAPGAIARTKDFLRELGGASLEEDLIKALRLHVEMRTSPEALEGFEAFANKRLPDWQR